MLLENISLFWNLKITVIEYGLSYSSLFLDGHLSTHCFRYLGHLSIFFSTLFDPLFDFIIYALQVCPSILPTYELYISLSGRKRKRHNIFIALVRIHKYHIYWETSECHTMQSLSFILKIYKNSGTMVKQRTWDIVLDLIVLSFNCSRPKWRLRSPMVEGNMGKFESQISLF